jgi:benzil reductase ((S)-benzoin forming)
MPKPTAKAARSLVWISGATAGLGWGLARTVPYADARVINLSRSVHPDIETVQFDLTRPETYSGVQRHFESELHEFSGDRAIFIHNGYYPTVPGFVSETDTTEYAKSLQANAVAPLILGDMFLRAVRPGYESGLALLSSAAARHPFEGIATYCAAKAGVEMWVRVVRRELARRDRKTWVVAIRPGFVDTPTTRLSAEQPAHTYPAGPQIARQLQSGQDVMTPEEAGRQIWSALPPKGDTSLLLFGEMVKERD